MKRTVKIISVILALISLISVIAIPASAEYNYPMAVTIYYKDESGNTLSPTVSTTVNAAASTKPTWTSPSISGYALKNDSDAVVTYDMLNKSFPPSNYVRNGSATYTVTYVKTYTHTVYYLNGETNGSVASSTSRTGKPGTSYSITAPSVTGMRSTKSAITGTFGSSNTSETVYYYPITYTLSYNANGGKVVPASQTKKYGETIYISSTKPQKTGYNFVGWSTSPSSSTVAYSPGDRYSANTSTTLYAIWGIKKYTVSFNANGGTGAPASVKKLYDLTMTLPTATPTKSGYVFLGWSLSSNATSASYSAGGAFSRNADATLYAVWERIPETYTVYYSANGGKNAPASQKKTEDKILTLTESIPNRTGYTFMGWATAASSSTVSYIPGGTYNRNASITLYAIWSPVSYTVTYDANGGANAPAPQTKIHDTAITLSTDIPYRDKYNFLGWSTLSTATYPTYEPGDTYASEGNETLFAVWEYINYDFSVSNLTVTPEETRQYETVQVRFRLDSWDQKNAYSGIPVQVILNGSTIYSDTVDFSIYGVNYVDFDLDVGALEGIQTLTVWVNRNDYLNETRTGNNTVSATFTVNKAIELTASYFVPNADYIEGNDVVTSFYVTNSGPSAIVPSDHMSFTFEVYTLDTSGREVTVHKDIWSDVVIPGNGTNLVYFKWTVPTDSAGTLFWCRGSVNENQTIAEDDLSNNRTEFNRYSVYKETSQPPNTRYETKAPASYVSNLAAPAVQNGKATWNMWEYQNGAFVLKTYGIQVSSGTPQMTPSATCKSATYSGGKWTMKSGYGISLLYSPVTASIPGYAMPQGSAYTGIQCVYATFPEYSYRTDENHYRTLVYANGGYRFAENPDADGNDRLHFIPVYVANGEYTVSVTVTQIWTPAGMITAVRNSNSMMIDGTIYDDFYVGS